MAPPRNLNNLIPARSGFQIQNATGINDNSQTVVNAIDTATGSASRSVAESQLVSPVSVQRT